MFCSKYKAGINKKKLDQLFSFSSVILICYSHSQYYYFYCYYLYYQKYMWMVEYSKVNVRLSDTQLKKLKNAVKNKTGTNLKISTGMFHGNNLPH